MRPEQLILTSTGLYVHQDHQTATFVLPPNKNKWQSSGEGPDNPELSDTPIQDLIKKLATLLGAPWKRGQLPCIAA